MARYYGPILLLAVLLATAACAPHLTSQHAEVSSMSAETSGDSSS